MLTIDLTPTEEAQLAEAARQKGVAPAEFARQLLREHLPPSQQQNGTQELENAEARERARIAAIRAARGSLAHVGVSVEDLHRERQADKEKEEQQIKRYMP